MNTIPPIRANAPKRFALFLEHTPTPGGASLVPNPGWGFRLMTVLTLTTGCAFVMWRLVDQGVDVGDHAVSVVRLHHHVTLDVDHEQGGVRAVVQVRHGVSSSISSGLPRPPTA